MKKLKNEGGFMLVESLVSLSIISLVIVTMIPVIAQMMQKVQNIQREVEGWRYFQDSVILHKDRGVISSRTSDGYQMIWSGQENKQQITISYPEGIEVLYVEILP
ncbi:MULTISPECIES: hypothetical protein [unclassified Jeotgalibaca]|uniref:hypothetical protein n=1 Tax=unclassified Jeotgalibaca TaxID=2621505 RepID=UPI003FD1F762